jgi:hypothetical protein
MKRTGFGLVVVLAAAVAVPLAAGPRGEQAAPQSRTIYVSIIDKASGKPIPGLTAADFKVRDGKDREITSVSVPTTRAKLTVLVEEALAPDTTTRQAILEFSKRMIKNADISIVSAGNRNTAVVPFTDDLQKILAGLNSITMVQTRQSTQMADGIYETAKLLQELKPERPIIVAIALEVPIQSGESADNVLNSLRLSRAVLEVVAVELPRGASQGPPQGAPSSGLDTVETSKVIGEGPKQSGGRRIGLTSPRAIPQALMDVANDLEAQYAITYAIPAGEKPQDRISVSTTKKNVTLLAPNRVNQN